MNSSAPAHHLEKRHHDFMPEHTSIATDYASAVAHPVRIRLVAALADGPRTLESLVSELDGGRATIRRHARALEGLDVLRSTDHHDGTRTYELLREPIIWDTAWGRLPLSAKRSAAAAAVTQMTAAATAAVDRGGFDREDMHLTRTTIRVDEARWRELVDVLGGTLHRLGDLAEAPEPDGSTGPTFKATAMLMLFTGEHAEADAELPASPKGEEEALEDVWAVTDKLDALANRASIDWGRVDALAEQLRLIARSMTESPNARRGHMSS